MFAQTICDDFFEPYDENYRGPAIYIFISDGRCCYVGQAENLQVRINSHKLLLKATNWKVKFRVADDSLEQRLKDERNWIQLFLDADIILLNSSFTERKTDYEKHGFLPCSIVPAKKVLSIPRRKPNESMKSYRERLIS